jgi:hypothetical protein
MEYWNKLPQGIRTSIVALLFVALGIATEWLTSVLESLQSPPV